MRILYNKDKWLDIFKSPKYETIRQTILNEFKGLTFIEDGHKYFLNNKEMECVSNVAHRFQEHIDTVKLATETFERNYNKSSSKYYQMTVDEIVASWKKISTDSCSHGTEIHEFGESAFYYMTGQYDKILPEFQDRITEDGGFKAISPKEEAVVKFYEEIPRCIVPILAETKVFIEYEKAGYAGTFDILFYYDAELDNKNTEKSGLLVLDWKGLDVTTPIFTKNKGWVTMGTIEVDDIVFDKNGKETKVIHTSSIHNKKCYKLSFDNNVEIIADFDHRWEIVYKGRNARKCDVMTSEELFHYHKTIINPTPHNIPYVNVCKHLQTDNKCEIPPYLLGVWIGSNTTNNCFHNLGADIKQELEQHGCIFSLDNTQSRGIIQVQTIDGFDDILCKYNLLNNKHLPNEVILSDIEYKKQVLAGLMDMFGAYNVTQRRFTFTTYDKAIANSIVQLISSMGVKSNILKKNKIHNRIKQICYVISYTCNFNPFNVKKVNITLPKTDFYTKAKITSIEECDSIPTRCIEVDSPTHTFLYGHQFMVTHNTNKDLYKNFKEQKLLPPFDGLLDMPLSVYKLQLSLYENALHKIGMKVVGRRILWLKPDGTYEKINLESYRDRIDKELHKIYD